MSKEMKSLKVTVYVNRMDNHQVKARKLLRSKEKKKKLGGYSRSFRGGEAKEGMNVNPFGLNRAPKGS